MFIKIYAEFIPTLQTIQEDLHKAGIEIWLLDHEDTSPPHPGMLVVDTQNCATEPIPREVRKNVNKDTPTMYIYTSGTTGQYTCRDNLQGVPKFEKKFSDSIYM